MHTNKVTKNIAIIMTYFCMLHSYKRLHAHIFVSFIHVIDFMHKNSHGGRSLIYLRDNIPHLTLRSLITSLKILKISLLNRIVYEKQIVTYLFREST